MTDDEILIVDLSGSEKETVVAKIKEKLTQQLENTEPDRNLLDYVMLLINNCRSRSHIINELEAFFGKESAVAFTKWLWKLLHAYRKSYHKRSVQAETIWENKVVKSSHKKDKSQKEIKHVHHREEKRRKLKRRGRQTETTKSMGSRNSTINSKTSKKGSSRKRVSSSSKHSSDRHRTAKSKRVRKGEEKRKDKRRRKSKRPTKRRTRKSRRHSADETMQGITVKSDSSKDDRLRKKETHQFTVTLGNTRKVKNVEHSLRSSNRSGNQSMESSEASAEEQSEISSEMDIEEDQSEEESIGTYQTEIDNNEPSSFRSSNIGYIPSKKRSGSTYAWEHPMTTLQVHVDNPPPGEIVPSVAKCSFWPNCAKGSSCPFHHPSTICQWYPNCKYGAQCLNIHPQGGYTRGRARGRIRGRARGIIRGRARGRGRGFASSWRGSWRGSGFQAGPPRGRGMSWRGRGMSWRGRGRGISYRGRGMSYRGRGASLRGRGAWRGKANMSFIRKDAKLNQPCMYDTDCPIADCPFDHPQEEKYEMELSKLLYAANKAQDKQNALLRASIKAKYKAKLRRGLQALNINRQSLAESRIQRSTKCKEHFETGEENNIKKKKKKKKKKKDGE